MEGEYLNESRNEIYSLNYQHLRHYLTPKLSTPNYFVLEMDVAENSIEGKILFPHALIYL